MGAKYVALLNGKARYCGFSHKNFMSSRKISSSVKLGLGVGLRELCRASEEQVGYKVHFLPTLKNWLCPINKDV